MTESLCKIKIMLKDYYPKLKIIPYNDYFCLISYDNDKFSLPLKSKESNNFESEPKKINSDLIYNISLLSNEDKSLISSSNLVIPYIRIIQVIKMKTLKYEQQIRFFIEKDIKEKIFGPRISVGSIFLKFNIEIIGIKDLYSNLVLPNNKNSKNKNKTNINFSIDSSITNLSVVKNTDFLKKNEKIQTGRQSRKYSTKKTDDYNHNCISINRPSKKKSKYLYIQTSPFALQNYYKYQSEEFLGKKSKRIYKHKSIYLSIKNGVKKVHSNDVHNNNINLKRFWPKKWNNKIYSKNEELNKDYFLHSRFSDTSIREKIRKKKEILEIKRNKNENKKIMTSKKQDNKNENQSETIPIEKNKTKKIDGKSSFKINNKSTVDKKKTKDANDESICKLIKRQSLKSKTSNKFYKNRNKLKGNEKIKNKENKTFEQKLNLCENKIKEFDFIKPVNNQEDLKNNIISMLNYFADKNKKTKLSYFNHINKADSKYLLYRKKIVLENKKVYSLQSQNDTKNLRNFIHVKINSKYNNVLFSKMSKIKIKEFNIINIILHNRNQSKDKKTLLQEKLNQQKQIHLLLNLIRNLLKTYGNLSHLYNENNNKKILIKSLFLRYNMKEKEWNNNDNIIEIYNKMINEINKKNKEDNKKILSIKKEFKVIREEDEIDEEEDSNIKEESFGKNVSRKKSIEESIKEISEERERNKKEEIALSGNEKEEMKENVNNENINQENIIKEKKEMKEFVNNENINQENIIKEKAIKYDKKNIIGLDEKINIDKINTELVNKKNIIINNFIINK